jgi:hypothetical protein
LTELDAIGLRAGSTGGTILPAGQRPRRSFLHLCIVAGGAN